MLLNHITDQVYLSDKEVADNKDIVACLGITHMVSILDSPDQPTATHPKVQYLRIYVKDQPGQNLGRWFERVYKFITAAINNEHKGIVLIHCNHCVSRSPVVTWAYLMRAHKMTYHEAEAHITQRHYGMFAPNDSFLK
jgi:protein-tyrosine phosphatase